MLRQASPREVERGFPHSRLPDPSAENGFNAGRFKDAPTPLARLYFNDCHHQEALKVLIRARSSQVQASGVKHEKIVLELAKIASVLVRFDHTTSFVINANHGIVTTGPQLLDCWLCLLHRNSLANLALATDDVLVSH